MKFTYFVSFAAFVVSIIIVLYFLLYVLIQLFIFVTFGDLFLYNLYCCSLTFENMVAPKRAVCIKDESSLKS